MKYVKERCVVIMSEEEKKISRKNIVYEDTLLEITPELMKKTILEQQEEIERLQNIIKEVREYIENKDNQTKRGIYPNYWYEIKVKDILEILDKGSDEISK